MPTWIELSHLGSPCPPQLASSMLHTAYASGCILYLRSPWLGTNGGWVMAPILACCPRFVLRIMPHMDQVLNCRLTPTFWHLSSCTALVTGARPAKRRGGGGGGDKHFCLGFLLSLVKEFRNRFTWKLQDSIIRVQKQNLKAGKLLSWQLPRGGEGEEKGKNSCY